MGFPQIKVRKPYLNPNDYDFVFDRSGNVTSILMNRKIVGVQAFNESFIKIFLFDNDKKSIFKKILHKTMDIGGFI